MNTTPQCILEVRQCYPELTGNYRKVADYIMASPGDVVKFKAKDIARKCNCDESTVIRFCQKMGYSGFLAFKAAMAADFIPLHFKSVKRTDSETEYFSEFKDDVMRAVKMISHAQKVILLGAGTSGIVAMDAQVKLLRLGINVIFYSDADFAKVMLGLLNPGDVVLAISYTGSNESVCQLAAKAKECNASIIAITNYPQSRLAETADVVLLTASDEKVFRLGAMTSRIAQSLAIDFLMLHLVAENLERSKEYVVRTHEMIENGSREKKGRKNS
jgi:DNA-binding MurR/RpiR family transcriptional regulator